MTTPDSTAPFVSHVDYDSDRIHAAAVYCSDGRVGEHFDDFLTNGLGLPRYDRVALPGGPGCIAGHDAARLEQDALIDELKFLVDAHELDRVVLIQHQNCAFYAMRLGLTQQMEDAQRVDLGRAAAIVQKVTGVSRVDAYFARRTPEGFSFEHVDVGVAQ